MVTTPKKSGEQTWTWSGAGFTRQTPSEKQTAAPESSLLYKRARYYDPNTGEFISRDPLGFVDGMSQYRAYFVPGAVDPSGLACPAKKTCGVKTFDVQYQWPKAVNTFNHVGFGQPSFHKEKTKTNMVAISVFVEFKDDEQHDPAKCEYSQWVSTHLIVDGQVKIQGNSFFDLHNDRYSRASDLDGNNNLSDSKFYVNDFPGLPRGPEAYISNKIDYAFHAFQFITDIDSNEIVAMAELVRVEVKYDNGKRTSNDAFPSLLNGKLPHTANVTFF